MGQKIEYNISIRFACKDCGTEFKSKIMNSGVSGDTVRGNISAPAFCPGCSSKTAGYEIMSIGRAGTSTDYSENVKSVIGKI